MAVASYLLVGKIIETVGAIAIAYVGLTVARIEWFVGRHLRKDIQVTNPDLESMKRALLEITEHRRKQFGPKEAFLIAFGTCAVAIGCIIYIVGILKEH